MARHAEPVTPTPPPPPPRPLLVEQDESDDGHFGLILGVVAMLCATALATSMVLAGHTATVGGLIALVLIVWGAIRVTALLLKIVQAVLNRFQ